MSKLLFSFGLIFLGICTGQIIKKLQNRISQRIPLHKVMIILRDIAFLILNPIVLINSFWIVDTSNITLIVLPFICIITLALGGGLALVFSRAFKHSNTKKAAMYACGTLSNVGTVGSLVVFTFLGEYAYSIAAMFYVFEPFYVFLIGYTFTKALCEGNFNIKERLKGVITDKPLLIYFSAILIGIALNFSSLTRPVFMEKYNQHMIPLVSFTLIFTTAYKMHIGKIKHNLRESFVIVGIKYVFIPLSALCIAYFFGLQHIENGLVIKVLIIMTLIPTSFNSLMLPDLFNADRDIINSAWIMTMLPLAFIIPLEYLFLVVLT